MSRSWFFFFRCTIVALVLTLAGNKLAAQTAWVLGTISNEKGEALEFVTISHDNKTGVTSNARGYYEMKVPAGKDITLSFSFVGYTTQQQTLHLKNGEKRKLNITLESSSQSLPEIEIRDDRNNNEGLVKIEPKHTQVIPTLSNGVESLVKSQMGVSSSNELSSQYNVRGGNFDENLVYVNDIEIYRPFLVRSAQQEGLSFVNPDLVSSVRFSAGGFDARYGDKMSSVLDIRYKKPTSFGGSAAISLLGGSMHLEGATKNHKLNFLIGGRYKTNKYILNSMETKGDYDPSFTDIQALINYAPSAKWEFSFLGNLSNNIYRLTPTDRETSFGTLQQAMKLRVYFDGSEEDKFQTMFGAVSATYWYKPASKLRLIVSGFNTEESETYDIEGQYWLNDVSTNMDESLGQETSNRGVGSYLQHARNRLAANIVNIEHQGNYAKGNNNLQWGLKGQAEYIYDRISEWEMSDSAGYTLPTSFGNIGNATPLDSDARLLLFNYSYKSRHTTNFAHFSGFLQDNYSLYIGKEKITIVAGMRVNHFTFNNETLFSPRGGVFYNPKGNEKLTLRFSTGIYYQQLFYKEMRNKNGQLNEDIRSQKSIHYVLGMDKDFEAWERPFKFTAELYYKRLSDLIPYEVDNVRIRYYATNNAKGYAAGIDFKLNGEFVENAESWFSISFMKTAEDLSDDFCVSAAGDTSSPGYIPRPTDQRVTFNMFFQDYIPRLPQCKIHLNLVYGTGLPFGAPNSERYTQTHRYPAYRRVDAGFSYQLISEAHPLNGNKVLRYIKSSWISLEVFNLLDINNTNSYLWVGDVYGNKYAVPNYLSPRKVNVKLSCNF